jgi:glutamate---cysteine ligase / carboxylate-amine ligase
LAAAGVHPFAAAEGELNPGERYGHTEREYGSFARRQLVYALQIHVAPGSADAALPVYNALRGYLPEIAALAANAPFHEGRDTELASVRPKLAEQLPRQGVPPPLASWEEYAGALSWGAETGAIPVARSWWWELRPHPEYGTLELRVPDAQTTIAEAAAVAAFVHSLVARLVELHGVGELPPTAPSWRIAENRWWAARDGVEGALADLATGSRAPARDRLAALVEELAPHADRLGCTAELDGARLLIQANGAMRQREVVSSDGFDALVPWLASRWLDPGHA